MLMLNAEIQICILRISSCSLTLPCPVLIEAHLHPDHILGRISDQVIRSIHQDLVEDLVERRHIPFSFLSCVQLKI